MRITVTGSQGFIGQILCKQLEEQGHEVWRFDRLVHSRYTPHKERMVYGDVSNPESCKRALESSQPDILVHLAAIATTDSWMYNHPNEMVSVTLNGTVNMSNAFSECNHPKQFVYASSSEIYGNAFPVPFTEGTEPHPCNIYGVAKWAGEKHILNWNRESSIPYTIMRNFNTYGNIGYQRTMIDRCTKEMLSGFKVVMLGNPNAIRDWEYVDDHVNSYLTVIGNEKAYDQTFNFCRGEPYTIRETVDRIMDATDYTGEVKWGTGFERKNDVRVLHGDASKAKRVLGWEARWILQQGLEAYVINLKANQ